MVLMRVGRKEAEGVFCLLLTTSLRVTMYTFLCINENALNWLVKSVLVMCGMILTLNYNFLNITFKEHIILNIT